MWIALLLVSIVLALNSSGSRFVWSAWLVDSVYYLCRILTFAILARVLLSWFMAGRNNQLIILLDNITEPVLAPLRRIIPSLGMFDITPLVAMLILGFIPSLFVRFIGFLA